MFNRKTETIKFNDFMDGDWKEKKKKERKKALEEALTISSVSGSTGLALFSGTPTYAMGMSDRIITAFDPIIELVQGVSYPVCFLMISGGFLLIMLGQRHKGLQMMKWAGVGYIGLQFAPAIMAILVEVGKAMVGK